MNQGLRRILEIGLMVVIVAISVIIFLLRDKIQNVSNISYLGLILLCLLANATVFLPSPSLMIAASCALIMNPVAVAFAAAFGSALGELVGYAFGSVAKELSPRVKRLMDRLSEKIKSPAALVLILAVLPLPVFDAAGVYSGGTKMNLLKFFALCFAGKLIKMLVYTRAYDIARWAASVAPIKGGIPWIPDGV